MREGRTPPTAFGPGEATGSAFPVAGVAGITQMFAALRRSDSTNSSGA